ncbi:MAG: DUF4340 domain-containing protein [Bacteroidia bacterium]|nr:DUF4340 domain-containing protein [Bacteroidia bacterium]
MFRKLNIKVLIAIFVVLLAIILISHFIKSKKGERTFRSDLAEIDTSQVSSILIYPKAENFSEVKLTKAVTGWQIQHKGVLYNADKYSVNAMLSEFARLKPQRVAATSKEKWPEFQLTDTTGTRVKVLKNNDIVADLMIGKFSYQKPTNPWDRQGKMSTYVRLANEENVYSVEGFLSMTFNRSANEYINKAIINSNKDKWTKLAFTYPGDSSFIMTIQDSVWMVNGIVADSAKVINYFNKIAHLTSPEIMFDFKQPLVNVPEYAVRIEGNNITPIHVNVFPTDTVNIYAISSSMNPGIFFSGGKGDVFKRLFIGKDSFFGKKE